MRKFDLHVCLMGPAIRPHSPDSVLRKPPMGEQPVRIFDAYSTVGLGRPSNLATNPDQAQRLPTPQSTHSLVCSHDYRATSEISPQPKGRGRFDGYDKNLRGVLPS
jgi:hypothetical protein